EIVVGFGTKFGQPLLILKADPARHGDIDGLEHALNAVFVLQAKGHDLELQLADGAENQVIIAQRLEQLGRAFLAQLRQTLLQGLHAQRILENGAPEYLRRKIRDARKGEVFTLAERIADVDGAVIM